MKICFVTDKVPKYRIGGAERQCFEVGKELAAKGHEVHMTSRRFSEDQPDDETIDGINVHTFGTVPGDGYEVIDYLRTRKDFFQTLRDVDCDLYHNTPPSPLTGLTRLFTQATNKRFTFALAHERDYDREYWTKKGARRRLLYYYGIKRADARVALADYMQEGLKSSFGLDSTRIYIGHPVPAETPDLEEKENKVIWMARLVPWKEPEKFIELAKSVTAPGWTFHLIGDGDDEEYVDHLKELASDVDSIQFEGAVEPGKDTEWFERAKLFVDTSNSAGFSNTFIQSWLQRTPVASLNLDPDSFIESTRSGIPPTDFETFSAQVQELLEDEQALEEAYANTSFAKETFGISEIAEQYESLFKRTLTD